MEPVASKCRWREVLPRHTRKVRRSAVGRVVVLERLCVELFDHAEAAELTLGPVPIAVVIAEFRGQLASREAIDDLDFRDRLDGERQWRAPWRPRIFILQ